MRREQGEAEGEVWAGEDGQGLDEDVGDGLVAGEMGVELVAARNVMVSKKPQPAVQKRLWERRHSDRANK